MRIYSRWRYDISLRIIIFYQKIIFQRLYNLIYSINSKTSITNNFFFRKSDKITFELTIV